MIKKAVALTLREYWRAVHGEEPEKEFPCEYPGITTNCACLLECWLFLGHIKKDGKTCWNKIAKVNGKYPIRRVGYKGGAGSDKKD